MSLFLSCIFYFVAKIRKTCYRKKEKIESLKSIYWLKKPVPDFCWLDHWKWLYQILCAWFLNFYQTERVWIVFHGMSCPKLSKKTVNCSKWVKRTNRVNFDLPKISKTNINFELLKVRKMTSLKIYISPVTEKLETSNLDTW